MFNITPHHSNAKIIKNFLSFLITILLVLEGMQRIPSAGQQLQELVAANHAITNVMATMAPSAAWGRAQANRPGNTDAAATALRSRFNAARIGCSEDRSESLR